MNNNSTTEAVKMSDNELEELEKNLQIKKIALQEEFVRRQEPLLDVIGRLLGYIRLLKKEKEIAVETLEFIRSDAEDDVSMVDKASLTLKQLSS